MAEIKIGKFIQIVLGPGWIWALDDLGQIWTKQIGTVVGASQKWQREQGPVIGEISNVQL